MVFYAQSTITVISGRTERERGGREREREIIPVKKNKKVSDRVKDRGYQRDTKYQRGHETQIVRDRVPVTEIRKRHKVPERVRDRDWWTLYQRQTVPERLKDREKKTE